ncbi:MAG: hypothetical protein RR324_07895 [Cellulosilyticaceae bacterium]
MNRFKPHELYEIFSVVEEDGVFDCPIFTSFSGELQAVDKCLALPDQDKKAMQQALRLAKKELSQEIAELECCYTSRDNSSQNLQEQIDSMTSKLCKLMRNYIQ